MTGHLDYLIRVEQIKKKFCRSIKQSMIYGVNDIFKDITGIKNNSNQLREGEFWSLDNISFELNRGECLGVIGSNGAGKSTLLKLLNGIILPDSGKITINGTLSSLIEIGAGFHPMLSGRENIYINASILGLSKEEIDNCFDSIVDFSELEDSIDMPVKHYSSGMYVRLGFAIAAHVKPDILILDEVLAVGDLSFVSKCFRYINSIKNDTAIILVSHDMRNISRMCDSVILINKGVSQLWEDTEQGINHYRKSLKSTLNLVNHNITENIDIKDIINSDTINQFDEFNIEFKILTKLAINIVINILIHREDGVHCCSIMSELIEVNNKVNLINNTINKMSLKPGNYYLSIVVLDSSRTEKLLFIENAQSFKVLGDEATAGVFSPDCSWKTS